MAVVNQPLFALSTLWLNEQISLPVSIVDLNNNDVSGMVFSGMNIKYNRHGDSTNQSFSPSSAQWFDKGRGLYELIIPASIINQEGHFEFLCEPLVTGYQTFRAAGKIEQRPESRVLNALASGFNAANSIGALVNAAGNFVEVFAGGCYNATAQTLTFMVFAQVNGGLFLTPTTSRVTVKDQSDATVMDVINGSPNGDGIFMVQGTTIVLVAKTAYKVRARVTINGVEYDSGEMLQSFD